MATIEVLKARIRLTACIQNLQERVEFTELKQREIQQTQEALKKHEEEMKRNEEFIVEFDEVYKVKQKIYERRWWWLWLNYGGAVCCTVCEENCHYPGCTLAWYPEHCEVMKDGRCTSCTRKCPVSDHVKEKWIYVTKTRKVQKTLKDVKEKYERGKTGCEENCHYPGCTLAQNPESSDVMKDGRCTSCIRKCPVSDHVKEKIYVNETSKVQKTLQDVKEKYERGKAGCEEKTSLLKTLEKQMEKLQKEKDQMLEESFELVVRLDQIALNVDSLSTHVHLDFLIEKMKEKGDAEKIQKLEEMKSRVNKDKGTRAALWYMSGKLTAAGKAVKAAVK
ncbi:uncharacterized protein LOC119914695 isoform X1 [Micropterus salmoides]|uniref:uncharacterized protein LOC119914695 isoform X1 n=1 Tax=Micropterus salmoides TaxID=27706 RepID=UPI0018ECB97B|nr:uncharacterized protein LOC119914695 isoform X1 [Micropterus salmoides]XP_038590083.1 uncharacterized protein LOC119914695 isoform X2 [Micropterus salmoides]XP_038590084.1 uncharacterized protein LOC119914695 isoform X1 [Micropterus salmoides]XP_038590085.1 uncharacterized protein LOC119914695 isoform X1 [Micropterus salmoides]XP_038590086.1 uncharacterized protein LOC119914695 isoform X1 [Micropterus salmoides]